MERHFFYKRNYNSKAVRKNAFWMEVNETKYLISYRTVVAAVDKDNCFHKFWNDYSSTTMNQINGFIALFDNVFSEKDGTQIHGFNKEEWLNYPTVVPTYDDLVIIRPYIPTIEYNQYDYVEKIIYN